MLDETISLVIRNSGALDRILRFAVRDVGVRWTALRVLADLVQSGPLTQKELVQIEQVKQATMSVLLRDLSEQKLITFRKHPDDGRSRQVVITPKGLETYRRCGEVIRPVVATLLEALTKADLRRVYDGERLLKEQIDQVYGAEN